MNWKKITGFLFITINASITFGQVDPLLTTTWNQGCYYNDSCPSDVAGPCGKVYTGCNATAMAQIMKYYQHPSSGWSSHSYSIDGYGLQSANFATAVYDWNAMPNILTSANTEVAKIMYHIGIAVNMMYSPTVSNSFFDSKAFKQYFKYSLTVTSKLKATYTETQWETFLSDELDAGRVIFVKGGGHFYIIDGYQTSPFLKFHANFGWGGLYNSYYDVHNIIVSGNNYTPTIAIVGIQPLTALEVSTDTLEVNSSAGSVSFEVSSLSSWNASSNQTWATLGLTSGPEGYYDFNNGATITVTNNSSYSPRYATLTFNDGTVTKVITVKQNGVNPYFYVNTNNLTYSSTGGTQTISIGTDSNWVATSPESWLSFIPSSGASSANIDIIAALNPTPSTRHGAVVITRGSYQQVINIVQGGSGSTWCTPAMNTPNSNGITNVTLNTINRISAYDEGYVLTNDTTLLNLDSTYTIFVSFQGNNAPAIWIDWNQDGDFQDAGEDIMSPTGFWYPSSSTKNVSLTVPSGAMEGVTRMRIYAKSFGTGPVSGPCGTSDDGGDIEDYHIHVRNSKFIDISPISLNYASDGATQNVLVESDSNWVVNTTYGWLSLSLTTGTGNGAVDITALPNPLTVSRTGTVTFTRGAFSSVLSVNQLGEDSAITIAPDTLNVSSTGGIQSYSITSNINYTVASNQSWLTSSISEGNGNQSPDATISNNLATILRTGLIIASNGTFSDTLVVVQDSVSTLLNASLANLNFSANGGNQSFNITTSSSWTASVSDSWLSTDLNSGTGNSTINVTCDTNYTISSRSGFITITNGITSATVNILQDSTSVTGIREGINNQNFIIYPNPTSGKFVILFDNPGKKRRIHIYDHAGRNVYQKTLYQNNIIEIDITHFPSSLYIIEIGTQKSKLIKK